MIRDIAKMAAPLVGAQLSVALMTFIDTLLMGKLGVEVLAGGGLGSVVYQFFYIVGLGVLVAVANIIAFSIGREDRASIKQSMLSGAVIVVVLSALTILILRNIEPLLLMAGQDPDAVKHASEYLTLVSWSLIPGFAFVLVRSLLIGSGDTKAILPISVIAAVLNYPVSFVLMTGMFGFPELGLKGIALGTCIITSLMFIGLLVTTYRQDIYREFTFWSSWHCFSYANLKETIKLGLPISIAHAMEIGLFSAAAFLIGLIGIVELAAHQVALQGTTLSFMIPLAISQAVSVKVGELYGAGRINQVKLAVFAGLKLCFVSAVFAAFVFIVFPGLLIDAFIDASTVKADEYQTLAIITAQILVVAAVFQLVDGWQVVFMGALRGFKLGLSPTVAAIFSYWLIGFPVSYWSLENYGAVGVWSGMGLGLAVSALLLVCLLKKHIRQHSVSNDC